jgi:type II secretory ATPase GspE/PulE/Tfp pilus assembly ATPase PilB-like protein
MLSSPSGLILVTGPTGVGKTTSMYAFVHELNTGERKINTIEDPIEYAVRGICQSQVAPKIDLDFAELLRSVMRQSPDVIMIGEIRDQETAVTAVRAANSGHLVLATLHASVAVLAVQSMILFGSQPVMLANSLLGVVAQRLLRTLNPATRIKYDVGGAHRPFEEVEDLLKPGEGECIYGPDETDEDSQNGYLTRIGLFEVLTINDAVREGIARQASRQELHRAAIEGGMLDFRRVALLKVAQGVTTIEEMTRVLPGDLLTTES